MKPSLISLLSCPECGEEVQERSIISIQEASGEIVTGLITCRCGEIFPIIGSVPVFLTGDLRPDMTAFLQAHGTGLPGNMQALLEKFIEGVASPSVQVKESFGYKWQLMENYGFDGGTRKFTDAWMYEGYGWKDEKGYQADMASRKSFLDAGTGLGREVARFCRANSSSPAIGVELSDAAKPAYKNVRQFPNAHIIQADLMKLPLKKKSFDFILSEGVLHHTPDTKKAFLNVFDYLAEGGEFAIYIYRVKPLLRELADEHIRKETVRMSEQECWEVCRHFTELGHKLQSIRETLTIDEDIPVLGIEKGTYKIQEFIYRYFMKCFWNSMLTFDENNLVNFDWYHPHYAFRHTPEEFRSWASALPVRETWFRLSESGIFFKGVRQP